MLHDVIIRVSHTLLHMQCAEQPSQAVRCKVSHDDVPYHVICVEPGHLSSYGLVNGEGVCSTCDRSRHHCRHVQVLAKCGLRDRTASNNVKKGDMFSDILDFESGQWKLSCISKMPLPEHPTGVMLFPHHV